MISAYIFSYKVHHISEINRKGDLRMSKKSSEKSKMVDKKNNKMVDKKANKMTDKVESKANMNDECNC